MKALYLKESGVHVVAMVDEDFSKHFVEGCTCDMCEFIAAEKAMEELGVKQETDVWEALLLAVDDLARDHDHNYYGLPHDKFSEFTEKLKEKGFTITRK